MTQYQPETLIEAHGALKLAVALIDNITDEVFATHVYGDASNLFHLRNALTFIAMRYGFDALETFGCLDDDAHGLLSADDLWGRAGDDLSDFLTQALWMAEDDNSSDYAVTAFMRVLKTMGRISDDLAKAADRNVTELSGKAAA